MSKESTTTPPGPMTTTSREAKPITRKATKPRSKPKEDQEQEKVKVKKKSQIKKMSSTRMHKLTNSLSSNGHFAQILNKHNILLTVG
jgi:hypothetical protein